MKHSIIAIILALALAMGIAAFAETTQPATDEAPAAAETATVENAADETPAEESADQNDDDAALREALEAYRAAKVSDRLDKLAEELNGYVEAGKLTQEQANLILNSVKERISARKDVKKFGSNAHGVNGQKGQFNKNNQRSQMAQGGRMNSQQVPNDHLPDAQSGATPKPSGRR